MEGGRAESRNFADWILGAYSNNLTIHTKVVCSQRKCEELSSCKECVPEGCFWCDSSRTCLTEQANVTECPGLYITIEHCPVSTSREQISESSFNGTLTIFSYCLYHSHWYNCRNNHTSTSVEILPQFGRYNWIRVCLCSIRWWKSFAWRRPLNSRFFDFVFLVFFKFGALNHSPPQMPTKKWSNSRQNWWRWTLLSFQSLT